MVESKPFIVVTSTDPVFTNLQVTCLVCRKVTTLGVLTEGFKAWCGGALIQVAIPELTADERELLISGTCGECFDEMFGKDDDEES